jgi:HTH-type transcriptional regulator / antitoxin HipB
VHERADQRLEAAPPVLLSLLGCMILQIRGGDQVKQRRSRADLRERARERGPLAAVLIGRREELGLRQEEVAELADCSVRFVHTAEAGKTTLRLDKLLDVLAVLGLRLEVERGARSGPLVAGAELDALYGLGQSGQSEQPEQSERPEDRGRP